MIVPYIGMPYKYNHIIFLYQILSFSVKNQEKFIAQKDKALRLFHAGNPIDNQMVLRDILKDRKASAVTDIPMFLVVTSNSKLE